MAKINEIGAARIAYPDRLGEKVMLHLNISERDELLINGVKITLPKEVYE